jgi:hypothetical protein
MRWSMKKGAGRGGGKRRPPILSSNKRGCQYFERRKTLKLQNFFLM